MLGVVLRIGDGLIEVGRVGSGCFSFQLVGLKVVQMLKGRWDVQSNEAASYHNHDYKETEPFGSWKMLLLTINRLIKQKN